MTTSLEYAKVELGIRGSYFNREYEIFGHLGEDTWLKHLWKLLSESGIQIEDKMSDFQLVRENDGVLSEYFAEAFKDVRITKAEWDKANKCRIYLQVLTVGDIASGNGKTVDEGIRKGQRQLGRARNLEWPVQGKPKSTYWNAWRKVLKESILNTNGDLIQAVGKWNANIDNIYCAKWEWWLDQENSSLYRWINDSWFRFRPMHQRKRRRGTKEFFKHYVLMTHPPPLLHMQRSSVTYERGGYIN